MSRVKLLVNSRLKVGRRAVYRLKVKEVASQKGITQSKLSRISDINNRTMHLIYYEPTTANITMSTLDKIAVALGVDISELIESVKEDGR